MSSNLDVVSIDNQADIYSKFNYEELMRFIKSYPLIQLNDNLWKKILNLAKVKVNEEKLKYMSYYNLYVEHLITQNYVHSVRLVIDRDRNIDFNFIVEFQFNTRVELHYQNINKFNSIRWKEFVAAAIDKDQNVLMFHNSRHGNVEIRTSDGYIFFSICRYSPNTTYEKYENGFEGSNSLSIPFELCKSSFDLAIKELEKFETL